MSTLTFTTMHPVSTGKHWATMATQLQPEMSDV